MKQFISILTPGRPELEKSFDALTESERGIFDQHVVYLKKIYDAGVVFFAGPTIDEQEKRFAVIVLNAESKEDAVKIIDADPAVSAGILRAKVHAFQVYMSREFK